MKKKLAAVVAAAGIAVAGAPAALAHDSVINAEPGVEATVTEFPSELVLVFSGIPREGFNRIALSRMDTNEVLFSGEPTVDRQNVRSEVPADVVPQPGKHPIGSQLTTPDGNATKGMTQFTYQPPGTTVETEAGDEGKGKPDETQQDANETQSIIGGYIWVWILLGVVLVGGAVIALLGQRQRDGQRNENRD